MLLLLTNFCFLFLFFCVMHWCCHVLVVLCITPDHSVWACVHSCPTNCECTQERSCSILCDRVGLTEIPSKFPCEAYSVNLDKNSIKFLSERAFGTLPSLKFLSLNHNNISFITPGAFKGLTGLIELKMAHNKYIRYLHTRTFISLKRLIRLDLADCNLFNIPDRIFVELPALQELFCFQNNLRRIPGAIRGMENLTHVYLEKNRIEAVAYNSLLGLTQLENLNLQDNRINVIHYRAFQDCQKMAYLYLNDNFICNFPDNVFDGLRHLKILNLGGNFLRNVSNTWFRDQFELEVLYLDRNQLAYIERGAFENLTSLMSLHLNSNNLTTLPFSVFQPVYLIGRLYLFQNPWECDCRIKWLKEWMENYRLVRDIPCDSPSSVTGLDLTDVFFGKTPDGFCLDPQDLNNTSYSPFPTGGPQSTTEDNFNSLISKLLLQKDLSEDEGNITFFSNNTTLLDELTNQAYLGQGKYNSKLVSSFHLLIVIVQAEAISRG